MYVIIHVFALVALFAIMAALYVAWIYYMIRCYKAEDATKQLRQCLVERDSDFLLQKASRPAPSREREIRSYEQAKEDALPQLKDLLAQLLGIESANVSVVKVAKKEKRQRNKQRRVYFDADAPPSSPSAVVTIAKAEVADKEPAVVVETEA